MGGRKGFLAKVVTSIDARIAGVVALLALLLRPPPAPQVALSTLRTRVIFIQTEAQRIKPLHSYQFEQVCDFAKQDSCSTFSFHNRGNKRGDHWPTNIINIA